MPGKLTVNANRVFKREKSPFKTWQNWKRIQAKEQDIVVVFDFDEEIIQINQKNAFYLQIEGLDAFKDSFRGNYLKMKCRDKNNIRCTVFLYGAVRPYKDYKRIYIEYEHFQISYHFT